MAECRHRSKRASRRDRWGTLCQSMRVCHSRGNSGVSTFFLFPQALGFIPPNCNAQMLNRTQAPLHESRRSPWNVVERDMPSCQTSTPIRCIFAERPHTPPESTSNLTHCAQGYQNHPRSIRIHNLDRRTFPCLRYACLHQTKRTLKRFRIGRDRRSVYADHLCVGRGVLAQRAETGADRGPRLLALMFPFRMTGWYTTPRYLHSRLRAYKSRGDFALKFLLTTSTSLHHFTFTLPLSLSFNHWQRQSLILQTTIRNQSNSTFSRIFNFFLSTPTNNLSK